MAVKKRLLNGLEGEEAEEHILKYLKTQNRPYGVNDIVNNLSDKVGKSIVQKTMTKLATSDDIIAKTYNKSTVYCIKQVAEENPNEEDKQKIEQDIERLLASIKEQQETNKQLESEAKLYSNLVPLDQLEVNLKELTDKINYLNIKLERVQSLIKESNENDYMMKAKEINDSYMKYKDYFHKRKKKFFYIFDRLSEESSKSTTEIMDEMSLDSDALKQNYNEILDL